MLKIETSGNARKSQWRKRDNKGNFSKNRRGSSKYYCYIQERYSDIYCFIIKSVVYPIPKDNFNKENLIKADKNLIKIKQFLFFLSLQKSKKITYSPNSINL